MDKPILTISGGRTVASKQSRRNKALYDFLNSEPKLRDHEKANWNRSVIEGITLTHNYEDDAKAFSHVKTELIDGEIEAKRKKYTRASVLTKEEIEALDSRLELEREFYEKELIPAYTAIQKMYAEEAKASVKITARKAS